MFATLLEQIESDTDDLLAVVYIACLATVAKLIGAFEVLPGFNSDGTALISTTTEFVTLGSHSVSMALGAAAIVGTAILVTNLGVEAIVEKPHDMEMGEFLLAIGVVALPVVIGLDLFGIGGHITSTWYGSAGATLAGATGVTILSDYDNYEGYFSN